MYGISFILLVHGIDKHVLRKKHAEFVKQIDTFCTLWPKT